MREGSFGLALLLYWGCFSPSFEVTLACESGLCPPGLFCVDQVCVARMDAVDAGIVDAAVADAGGDAALPAVELRINVFGADYDGVDYPGTWSQDPGLGGVCNGFEFTTAEIQGTVDDELFFGMMFDTVLRCAVGASLPAGDYDVTLLFFEPRFGPNCVLGGGAGGRVFDVLLEGQTVDTDLDLFVLGNGCAADATDPDAMPVSRTYRQTITDGVLDIEMPASAGTSVLAAVSVVSAI